MNRRRLFKALTLGFFGVLFMCVGIVALVNMLVEIQEWPVYVIPLAAFAACTSVSQELSRTIYGSYDQKPHKRDQGSL